MRLDLILVIGYFIMTWLFFILRSLQGPERTGHNWAYLQSAIYFIGHLRDNKDPIEEIPSSSSVLATHSTYIDLY